MKGRTFVSIVAGMLTVGGEVFAQSWYTFSPSMSSARPAPPLLHAPQGSFPARSPHKPAPRASTPGATSSAFMSRGAGSMDFC